MVAAGNQQVVPLRVRGGLVRERVVPLLIAAGFLASVVVLFSGARTDPASERATRAVTDIEVGDAPVTWIPTMIGQSPLFGSAFAASTRSTSAPAPDQLAPRVMSPPDAGTDTNGGRNAGTDGSGGPTGGGGSTGGGGGSTGGGGGSTGGGAGGGGSTGGGGPGPITGGGGGASTSTTVTTPPIGPVEPVQTTVGPTGATVSTEQPVVGSTTADLEASAPLAPLSDLLG